MEKLRFIGILAHSKIIESSDKIKFRKRDLTWIDSLKFMRLIYLICFQKYDKINISFLKSNLSKL